jgi:hypothetical protein
MRSYHIVYHMVFHVIYYISVVVKNHATNHVIRAPVFGMHMNQSRGGIKIFKALARLASN